MLTTPDVRALFNVLAEIRELGADPRAWRAHLAGFLETELHCRAVVLSELQPRRTSGTRRAICTEHVSVVDRVTTGAAAADPDRFFREVFWFDHRADRSLDRLIPLYGTDFTRTRPCLVDDATWHRSPIANERWRPNDCDDFLLSARHVGGHACSALALYRPWRDRAFGERELAILDLLHDELRRDFAVGMGPRLAPRARAVLTLLETGSSEKEIAADLGLSVHTTHDHVKAIYRAYGVRARPELMARLATARRGRVRLAISA
jgi:DNA-binding CsgD family transcriptional regulator